MQLALVPRDYDQSWLSSFLKTIKEVLTLRGGDFSKQEDINKEMLQELPVMTAGENHDIDIALDDIIVIRENLSKVLVKRILFDYFQELQKQNIPLEEDLKIAFDFYGSGILVWIEPNGEDKELEDKFFKIEMNINSKYSKQQIEMQTVVFDKSYGFEFPPQYV